MIFPQHGEGKKHDRPIVLAAWQQAIVDAYPLAFWRGLYHTDGARFENRVPGGYSYTRYQFTNCSPDIIRLFCNTTERLGLHWTRTMRRARKATHHDAIDVLISRREDVAYLDAHVGAKA